MSSPTPQLMIEVKAKISEGIAIQRINYLRMAVTSAEIAILRTQWDQIIQFGLSEAGVVMCRAAIDRYNTLLKQYQLESKSPPVDEDSDVFSQFVTMTMTAFNVCIECWTQEEGFLPLPDQLKDYVVQCMLLDVCPTLLRKAAQFGLTAMITVVLGSNEVTECTNQMWRKIYRVTEQAIIANIAEY